MLLPVDIKIVILLNIKKDGISETGCKYNEV